MRSLFEVCSCCVANIGTSSTAKLTVVFFDDCYYFCAGESTIYARNESYARALLHWSRAASQGKPIFRAANTLQDW